MGKLEDKVLTVLKKYHLAGIDTMVFIYHFEENKIYQSFTTVLFDLVEKGVLKAIISTISILEILVKPKKDKNEQLVEEYKFLFQTFPNLKVLPLDEKIADIASTLRADYNIKAPDAIQIASAISGGADVFITNEPFLRKVNEIDILILRDVLGV